MTPSTFFPPASPRSGNLPAAASLPPADKGSSPAPFDTVLSKFEPAAAAKPVDNQSEDPGDQGTDDESNASNAGTAQVDPELAQIVAPLAVVLPPEETPVDICADSPVPPESFSGESADLSLNNEYTTTEVSAELVTDESVESAVEETQDSGLPAEVFQASEKTAASLNAKAASRPKPVGEELNDKFLSVDAKALKAGEKVLGTEAAKPDAMIADRTEKPLKEPRFAEVVSVQAATPAPLVSAVVERPATPTTTVVDKEIKIASTAAAAAAVVREVVGMTDDFRARGRSSVELNFDFKDSTRVAVRVAYRDGEVQMTFKTDTPELREALNREWKLQAVAAASSAENRPYRLAEPVFTSSNTNGQGSGSAANGDTHQQRSFSGESQANASRAGLGSNAFNTASKQPVAVASAASVSTTRPDTVRHLHAFA